jgi:hypothetical protein
MQDMFIVRILLISDEFIANLTVGLMYTSTAIYLYRGSKIVYIQ